MLIEGDVDVPGAPVVHSDGDFSQGHAWIAEIVFDGISLGIFRQILICGLFNCFLEGFGGDGFLLVDMVSMKRLT